MDFKRQDNDQTLEFVGGGSEAGEENEAIISNING
jgi:hypothetical protein